MQIRKEAWLGLLVYPLFGVSVNGITRRSEARLLSFQKICREATSVDLSGEQDTVAGKG